MGIFHKVEKGFELVFEDDIEADCDGWKLIDFSESLYRWWIYMSISGLLLGRETPDRMGSRRPIIFAA
jgi:hypothetical protein